MLSISMDSLAKNGYKNIKPAQGKPVNTVDAVLVDKNNEWYLIEFKDCMISQKDNIKKGMVNFLKTHMCILKSILKEDLFKILNMSSFITIYEGQKIVFIEYK